MKLKPLFSLIALFLIWPSPRMMAEGENYVSSSLVTHAAVSQVPADGPMKFHVKVNGHATALYSDHSHWGGQVCFGQFEFEPHHSIAIDISYDEKLQTFEVLPKSLRLERIERTSENSIRIITTQPDQHITIIPNDEPQKDVLHLFAQSIDHNDPAVASSGYIKDEQRKLHYFGPGYFDLNSICKDGTLLLESGWTVYVAAGAIVEGQIAAVRQNNLKILGRGMLFHSTKLMSMHLDISEHILAEGVLFFSRSAQMWQVPLWLCQDIKFKNIKIICTRYASTDGLDVHYCQNGTFKNLFIRANDDCITIKGMDKSAPPSTRPANRNLKFEEIQMWNDCNNAFTIGEESAASIYENISLRNSTVLHSYDDPNHHDDRQWCDSRAAWSIIALNGTYFKNIIVDGLDVHYCERLLSIGFYDHFWNEPMGDQKWPGGIRGVILRNIRSYRQSSASCANEIQISGWPETPEKWVENVHLEQIWIAGKRLKNLDSPYLRIGPFVKHVTVK